MELLNQTHIDLNLSEIKPSDSQTYVGVGAWNLLINVLVFSILFSNRLLLRQSALLAGIAFGNFVQGLYLFWVGTYRLAYPTWLNESATAIQCASLLFPFLFPLGLNAEALFLCLGGIERFLAVNAATWFRKNWTSRFAWKLFLAAFFLSLISLSVALTLAFRIETKTTWHCVVGGNFGEAFVLFCQFFTGFGGLISALMTLIALISGVYRVRSVPYLSGDAGRLRKQLQLTKSMLMVSLCDLGLVAVPEVVSALPSVNVLGVSFPSFIRGVNSFYTNSANSTLALAAFLMFNRNFRRAAFKLGLKLKTAIKKAFGSKLGKSNRVHVVQPVVIELK